MGQQKQHVGTMTVGGRSFDVDVGKLMLEIIKNLE